MGSVIKASMASSKLTLLFAIAFWACVDCNPTGEESPIELTEREIQMREMEMKRLFEDRAAMMEATDRDLHNEDYKNITGLAKVLNQFLEEQYDQMDMEGEHLDQEESEVAAAKAALNSHPCPCAVPPAEEEFPPGT